MATREEAFLRAAKELYFRNPSRYDSRNITIEELARELSERDKPSHASLFGTGSGAEGFRSVQTTPEYFEAAGDEPMHTKEHEEWRVKQGLSSELGPTALDRDFSQPLTQDPRINPIDASDTQWVRDRLRSAYLKRISETPALRGRVQAEKAKGIQGGPEQQALWAQGRRWQRTPITGAENRLRQAEGHEKAIEVNQEYLDTLAQQYGYDDGREFADNVTREQVSQLERLPSPQDVKDAGARVRRMIPDLQEAARKEWVDGVSDGPAAHELREAKSRIQYLQRREVEARKRANVIRYFKSGETTVSDPVL